MKVLLAFDKFKDNMPADSACSGAAAGVRAACPGAVIERAGLSDGGEGFCQLLTEAAGGRVERCTVGGPLGEPVEAPLGLVDASRLPRSARELLGLGDRGTLALVEMASAAGLQQVPEGRRDPRATTTRGVGEMLRAAAGRAADRVLLGIGGSATSDLGLGALEALGLRFEGCGGEAICGLVPGRWHEVRRIAGGIEAAVPSLAIACDVDNPLLGPRGAARVYGPQKGLPDGEIDGFDREAGRLAGLLCDHFGAPHAAIEAPGSGAAGGIAFGLTVALGARTVPGFDLVACWLDLERKIAEADLVLTGEGRFDLSSLDGKGPGSVARSALARGKTVVVLAGALDRAAVDELGKAGGRLRASTIDPPGMTLAEALKRGPENIERTAARVLGELELP